MLIRHQFICLSAQQCPSLTRNSFVGGSWGQEGQVTTGSIFFGKFQIHGVLRSVAVQHSGGREVGVRGHLHQTHFGAAFRHQLAGFNPEQKSHFQRYSLNLNVWNRLGDFDLIGRIWNCSVDQWWAPSWRLQIGNKLLFPHSEQSEEESQSSEHLHLRSIQQQLHYW